MELKYQIIIRIIGHDTVLYKRIRNLTGDIARHLCNSPLLAYWLFNGGLPYRIETMKELKTDRRYLYLTKDIYLCPFRIPAHSLVEFAGEVTSSNMALKSILVN